MSAAEDLLVHLGAGLADRRGRDRLRLRQGHLELAAVVPQLGQHRGVAAPVGREHQPEHEQHHQQRVEGPSALDPLPVVRARHAHQGADQLLPELHEARPGPRRAAARLGRLGRALLQDPAPVRMQRVHVHILGRLGRHSAHRPARLRLADALPVGCPVAGPLMLPRVHVGLGQHRLAAVPPLPVLRQLPQRQPQGLRRQALHLDPRQYGHTIPTLGVRRSPSITGSIRWPGSGWPAWGAAPCAAPRSWWLPTRKESAITCLCG